MVRWLGLVVVRVPVLTMMFDFRKTDQLSKSVGDLHQLCAGTTSAAVFLAMMNDRGCRDCWDFDFFGGSIGMDRDKTVRFDLFRRSRVGESGGVS
jgi:hypothetical protein